MKCDICEKETDNQYITKSRFENRIIQCCFECSTEIYKHDEYNDDTINHPKHYCSGGIECIDAIKSALTKEEFRGYIKGNILKYTWRERYKKGDEDLKKAKWYVDYILEDNNDKEKER